MTVEHHPPAEEYLGALFELQEEDIPLIQARLAERLGHTAPTVSETVGRLRTDGYLQSSGRNLELTPKGRTAAESVVRKHRLAERLLADVIGLEWHKVHLEAGRWEHVISDDVERRLIELLNNPATCPHGNPIPGSGAPRPADHKRLSSIALGERVRLERVTETVELDSPTLAYLDEHGLRPGAATTVQAKSPDGTLMLETESGSVALSAGLAEQLYVSAVPRTADSRLAAVADVAR